jgi:hypothetical protein
VTHATHGANRRPAGAHGPFVPASRFLPFLEQAVTRHGITNLGFRAGISIRRIHAIQHKQNWVSVAIADRLLTAAGMTDVWYLFPPDGLADLYDSLYAAA